MNERKKYSVNDGEGNKYFANERRRKKNFVNGGTGEKIRCEQR